ncbi:hypothetical protein C7I87_06455 [Mesorhizobium sp. SARCC-RB16n]|uniref:DUF6680 family protein n=1 Tax=Mesorhizobium sp. SARCC-RB16n TaxID=2116687 RepID=UPI00122F8310|nr:DUF6680 family protein [Mesorhizobium sp. SARCC-RB16n]KAA3451643.1 hypothetical protein C7I87_06455 [Mesorhizobium sp. SARCC-RB16n]
MDAVVFLGMRWIDIATITAIVVGPILAVAVDRFQQRWTERKRRRLPIFRDLMGTRKARLDPVHVGALNLIDLEFYQVERVMVPFRAYMDSLYVPMPMPEAQERFFDHRNDLFVGLLHAIGRELGYAYDKHDLEKLAYGPTGWNNDQNMQRQNMTLVNELLSGVRALPVTAMQPTSQNPFPPAPTVAKPEPGPAK